ncbi:MAG: polysaccharide deacetylase family protein [Deltaproteobacteria bacterium]|nr:polysaccharide deacetylase family protein [Deltaproteobacteria bacterium]
MPFKVVFFIFLLGVSGVSITALLSYRLFVSVRRGGFWPRFRDGLIFLLFAALALSLSGLFLPCFPLFGEPFCGGSVLQNKIALTFDDGPNEPFTSQILDILKAYEVPATFFLVGKHVVQYPETVERMVREGHAIGNHTWSHHPLVWKGVVEIEGEIEGAEKAMQPLIPVPSKLFRSPHGWKNPFLVEALDKRGYRLIGWSRGVWDTDRPSKEVLFRRLTRGIKGGEIILLHDGDGDADQLQADRSATVAVLPEVIAYYRRLGFQFVTIPDMGPTS